ncbi:protein ECT2 [Hyalella azteca]|uniref:Protein ECT2 n=1 Tax=Hyalella azteca TaxID=294128 RepID=A0A979FFG0_HYAAZ|nr:protein ECT2 [Hyalella azteca]
MDSSKQPSLDDTMVSHLSNTTTLTTTSNRADLRLCLVGQLASDVDTLQAAQKFHLPVVTSENGLEYAADQSHCTYFVVADFESPEYAALHEVTSRILGKPALLDMAITQDGVTPSLVLHTRPVYCHVMRSCIVVFTGFKRKNDVARLLRLIHMMGGSIKNEMGERVTHLIAVCSTGDKYQYAVTFGIPVVTQKWVDTAWAHRDDIGARAANTDMEKEFYLGVFHNLRVVLVGFNEEDQQTMQRMLDQNSGTVTELKDKSATHVVLEDQRVKEKPPDCPPKAHVVKAEWFWASIQINACANESLYTFEVPVGERGPGGVTSPRNSTTTPASGMGGGGGAAAAGGERGGLFSPATPRSRSRRRKRLRETMQQLASDDSPCAPGSQLQLPASKRRSSVADLISYVSGDGSLLDDSHHTPAGQNVSAMKTPLSPPSTDLKHLTPRQRVFHELVKTECNYVAILDTINKVIKEPLEDDSQPGGPLLDSQELRYIFGHLPPIHDVHTKMRNDFLHLAHNWHPDASIGQIILNYSDDLEKAYPPFVNYFENVKEMLEKICHERPRFHAFLKIAQSKPECSRQSFQELLIRPVQRLPSMSLLLNDMLKHTDRNHNDHTALSNALDKIKSVMTFINDNKRKTEAKLKLFEIHNDIEYCPPNLVASHRTYVSRADATELSDTCSGRGDSLTLFVFNDVLEENFLVPMDPHHLDIESSDVGFATSLSKALRFAARTGRKVSRAFSFNKSPGGKLKRAVSTVMSPFATLPNPAMRAAASVTNLADLSLTGTPPPPNSSTMGGMNAMVTPTSRRRLPLKNL